MAINLNDNILTNAPKPSDSRYGPWTDVISANAGIPLAIRYVGLTIGITGVAGVTDYWYASGIADNNLIAKIESLQGVQGVQGVTGSTGNQGVQGVQGVTGSTGSQGVQGVQGVTGSTGSTGSQGVQGVQGLTGSTGSQGVQGVTGSTGSQGVQGVQGVTGSTGNQGVQGVQGVTGSTGSQGVQGVQGVTGSTGSQGTQGVQGRQGVQGLQGVTGSTGSQGVQGVQGLQGVTGSTGSQGVQGVQGIQGTQGLTGPSTLINATNTTTNALFYPVFISGAGTNQTPFIDASAPIFGFNPASGFLYTSGLSLNTQSPNAQLHIYNTISGSTIFNAEGTNGSLFSIVDNLSGSLMSVNNNAGLPIFEVFSDDSIVAGRFAQNDFVITSGGNIGIGTSNPTQKLQINGNVRISGALFDSINASGNNNQILLSTGSGIVWTNITTAALQGLQGTQGLQGVQGVQGVTGSTGSQGVQGVTGSTGNQGVQGVQGVQGSTGSTGSQGVQGVQGVTGSTGSQGVQGVQGVTGSTGSQGVQGVQGVTGSTGSQGVQGVQGLQGLQGVQGIQGVQGLQGLQGRQGTQGLQGTQGTQGVQGVQGTQGVQGLQGLQGVQGVQGTQGVQGVQGLQGLQGRQGTQGLQGLQGVQGVQGTQGIQGFYGAQGLQGLQGAQGISSVDTVTTALVAGTGISLDYNSSADELFLNITATGLGIIASASSNAYILVDNGNGIQKITIANAALQGIQGLQGLQGRQGTQGLQGLQGAQGTQGVQGLQGLQGVQGVQGLQGLQGRQGTQGLQGVQGTQGVQGLQGIQGVQGIQGLQGVQGIQGVQGLQGLQGRQGTQGLQGVQGIQGLLGPNLPSMVTGVGINSHIAYWNSISGITADNGQLYWDASNNRLGIGTSTPFSKLHIAGDTSCDGALKITYADTNIGDNNGTDLTPWKTIINDGTINTYNNGGFGFFGQGYNITLNGNGGDTGGASLSVNGSINCSSGIIDNNLTIGGNLIVNGTTVTANVDTMTIEDPIITLGLASGNIVPVTNSDRGLALIRATGLTAFMGWDTSASQFVMLSSGVATNSSGNYDSGTYGNLRINDLTSNTGIFNGSLLVGGPARFTIGAGGFGFQIDRGDTDPGFGGDILKLDVNNDEGVGYSTTLMSNAPGNDIIVQLPADSGTLARISDVNTSIISGVLSVAKGGTNRSTYSNGQLLIGSGTSLVANTLSAGTGISITNGSGTITINTSGLQTLLTNPVTGTGTGASTSGYLPRWNSTSGLNNSLIFDNGTNVGIRTITPSGQLHIIGTGIISSRLGIATNSPGATLDVRGSAVFNEDGTDVDFRIEGDTATHLFFVDASEDNVGIGYSSPSTKLQVNGSFSCGLGSDPSAGGQGLYVDPATPLLRFNDSGPNTVADIDVNGLTLYDFTSTSFFYTDRTNARIGIGTATPSETLDVYGVLKSLGFKSYGIGWFGASDGSLGLGVNDNPSGTFGSSSAFVALQGFNDAITSYNPICLTTQYGPQLYLNTDGNVGIGTAAPLSKLQVAGDTSCDGALNITQDISNGVGLTDWRTIINGGSISTYDNINIGFNGAGYNVSINGNGGFTGGASVGIAGDLDVGGNLTFDSFTESVVAIGNSSTSKTISLTSGTVQTCTLTGNCTFTMPTATAGKSFTMFLNSGSGNYTASFSGVRWADSATPTATILANKVDIYSFISDGSYWYGSFSQNYG